MTLSSFAPSALAVAGLVAGPAAVPTLPATSLPAPTLTYSAPSLAASVATPVVPVALGAPVPSAADVDVGLLVSRGWAKAGPWLLVLREGVDRFGRKEYALDALEADAPGDGAVGHVDATLQQDGSAVLDGPLSPKADDARLPPGAEKADLSHWRAEMWFGFAVLRSHQGRGLGALLLGVSDRLASRAGAKSLIVYATESSRSFYLARYGAAVEDDEPFVGADEGRYHRLVVRLPL